MHLVLILAVLVAMTLAEHAPTTPVDHPAWRLCIVLFGMLAMPGLAATLSAVVLRGIRRDVHSWATWLARFSLAQQAHAALWLAFVAAVSYGLGWPQLVRENWGLGRAILIDDLLILAPVYVPLLLSWAVYYEVDRMVEELTIPDDSPEPRLPARWRYVLMHARHYLALVLVPLLFILGVHDVANLVAPELASGPQGWLIMAAPLALLIVALPQLLTSLWKTERMAESPLRSRLEAALADCRIGVRDILVWKTERRMVNAAVSGLWSQMRYLFLTDGLLARLNDEQVEAVLRHEAGHIARRHLLLRMLMLCLPIIAWCSLEQVAPQTLEAASQALANAGLPVAWQSGIVAPLVVACYGIFGLGWYCKQLEFEADLYACGLLTQQNSVNSAQTSVAFTAALMEITESSGADPRRDGWLHPSIARRVAFISASLERPRITAKFERRLRWCVWLIVGGYALCLGAVALSF
ncbi:MAG TPA: M48 family metallopeptidase [Pirellulaceae bacterium]|nr:M48 family metallopeptidase [Pirellulaceae bacterium]